MYRGRCVGRLIAFLGKYWSLSRAHDVVFAGDCKTITYFGEAFATYTWRDDTDIPLFTFVEAYSVLNQVQDEKLDQVLDLYGYRKLHPDDEFVGTTGIYLEHVNGTMDCNPEPSRLTPAEERKKRKDSFLEQLKKDKHNKQEP